jgi:hypothetical protein
MLLLVLPASRPSCLHSLQELTGVLENAPQDESFLDEQGPAAAAALLACASKLHHNKVCQWMR